jgi:hypothetical protein
VDAFDFRTAAALCRQLAELFDRMAESSDPGEVARLVDRVATVFEELDELINGQSNGPVDGR